MQFYIQPTNGGPILISGHAVAHPGILKDKMLAPAAVLQGANVTFILGMTRETVICCTTPFKRKNKYDIISFASFRETFLEIIQISELMMSSSHNFLFNLFTGMTHISYFSYERGHAIDHKQWLPLPQKQTNKQKQQKTTLSPQSVPAPLVADIWNKLQE